MMLAIVGDIHCSLPNDRFIKNARTNRTRGRVIEAAQIIIAFAHHITSFEIGFGYQRTGSNACP